jgi:endonuclease/exonuclease/phosphatase (EEP) superfamily protein YafD
MADVREASKSKRSGYLADRVPLLAITVLLLTVLGRAARWWWVFELLSHFALQLLVASALIALLALATRAWGWLAAALIALCLNGVQIAPLHYGYAAVSRGTPMRVLAFNVHAGNTRREAVIDYLRHSQAEVLLVEEVTPEWEYALRWLTPDYRFVALEPRPDNFGIALLTRIEGMTAELVRLPDGDIAAVEGTLQWEGSTLTLLGIHTLPPVSAELAQRRNEALGFVAAWMRRQPGPYIVLGDLNVSPYSPYFAGLLNETGARNSLRGFGPQASWPQGWWPLWPAQIPIDHLLHGEQLVTMVRETGPALGSDHRPLVVTLALAK